MFDRKNKYSFPRAFITLGSLVLLAGCSHGLVIESDPDGAEVTINGKVIGPTPLEIKGGDLPPKGNLQVQIVKDGMGSILTYLPNPVETGTSQRVMILVPKIEPELNKINRHTGLMIRAHQLFLQGRTYESKMLIDEASLENPNYLYPYLLKGAILFLNNDFEGAMVQYKKAETIDPDNVDTRRLIEILTKKMIEPKRLPASKDEKAATANLGGDVKK